MLALTIATEGVKAVARGYRQVPKYRGRIQLPELTQDPFPDIWREPA